MPLSGGIVILPSSPRWPAHHKDPFDRRLIVQANVEEAIFISHDPVFAHDPVTVMW
jgi:PIN domain nuclease of toxin-antitoxin system